MHIVYHSLFTTTGFRLWSPICHTKSSGPGNQGSFPPPPHPKTKIYLTSASSTNLIRGDNQDSANLVQEPLRLLASGGAMARFPYVWKTFQTELENLNFIPSSGSQPYFQSVTIQFSTKALCCLKLEINVRTFSKRQENPACIFLSGYSHLVESAMTRRTPVFDQDSQCNPEPATQTHCKSLQALASGRLVPADRERQYEGAQLGENNLGMFEGPTRRRCRTRRSVRRHSLHCCALKEVLRRADIAGCTFPQLVDICKARARARRTPQTTPTAERRGAAVRRKLTCAGEDELLACRAVDFNFSFCTEMKARFGVDFAAAIKSETQQPAQTMRIAT